MAYFENNANDNEVQLLKVAAQPVDRITPEIKKKTSLRSQITIKKVKSKNPAAH